MKTSPLKIAIVDHDEKLHPLYRFYFSDHDEYELVGIHTSINQYMSHTSGNAVDIVVCEVQLTGLSGIDGIPIFHKKSNVPQILMTSQKCDFKIIKEAFKKGASGFLTKPLTKSRFFNALDELNEHGIALEHDVAKKIIHSFQSKSYERFSKKKIKLSSFLPKAIRIK